MYTGRDLTVIVKAARADAAREAVKECAADAKIVADMLELGDTRLMACDGPCGVRLPDLSPEEWGKVYRACKRIAKRLA